MNPICPYCSKVSKKVTGKEIYPHLPRLHEKIYYQCKPCGAYVGCHPGTERALGDPANKELRTARVNAHSVFDVLRRVSYWKIQPGKLRKNN